MKGIHEMQISNGINDRSIFSSLISMGSWLIVLLLCNYPEFAEGLDNHAVGVRLVLYFTSSPRGPACNLGLWRSDNPLTKAYWLCHLQLMLPGV